MNDHPPLVIFGASGHAKVVIDLVERQGTLRIAQLADDNPALHGRPFFGYPVLGGRRELLAQYTGQPLQLLVAIGNNRIRAELAAWAEAQGFGLAAPAIHPSVQLARGAVAGAGSVLMAGSVINADAAIGHNVIVNTGATIDHDCRIGDNAHVAPGATLCGNVTVGDGTLVGAGAVILPNLTLGANVVVGAGATIISNVPDGCTVVGTPARTIR